MDAKFLLVLYAAVAIPFLYSLRSREWLPFGRNVRWTITIFAAILAAVSFLFRDNSGLGKLALLAGIAPFAHLAIYAAGHRLFFNIIGRAPVDVTFNWKTGLFWDRCFAFLVIAGPSIAIMFALFSAAA